MSLESLPKQKGDEQMENVKGFLQGSNVIQSRKETNSTTDSNEGHNSHYKNIVHLWEFLMELLADDRCTSLISWSRKEHREFKLKDQEEVAKRWGKLKKRPGMNYDKLSRALRYYYRQGIIKKVPGQRLVYKFDKLPYEYQPRIVGIRMAKQKQKLQQSAEMCNGNNSPQFSTSSNSRSSSLSESSISSSSLPFHPSSIPVPAFPFLLSNPYLFGNCQTQLLYNSSISHPSWLEVAQAQTLKNSHVSYPQSAPASITTFKFPSLSPFENEECFQSLPKLKLTKCRSIPVSVITKNINQ